MKKNHENHPSSCNYTLTILQRTSPGNLQIASLPNSTLGSVWVRIQDTDQTAGNRNLNTVNINRLLIRTDLDPSDYPPLNPSKLVVKAMTSTEVQLTWQDHSDNERGFNILRSTDGANFTLVGQASSNTTIYVDPTASPNTQYWYQVEAFTFSYVSESNIATETTPDGLSLSASGYKRKGIAFVDLSWVGGSSSTSLQIWRSADGGANYQLIATVPNSGSGSYTDNTGIKGSATVTYQICTPVTPGLCSNPVSLTF